MEYVAIRKAPFITAIAVEVPSITQSRWSGSVIRCKG